jgi:hypothetical protein
MGTVIGSGLREPKEQHGKEHVCCKALLPVEYAAII